MASINTKHLRRCISPLSLFNRDRRHATTTWLSHWHRTLFPFQRSPHAMQANTIGINSFWAMVRCWDLASHCSWNHMWQHEINECLVSPPDGQERAVLQVDWN